ncbi:MAG TPA: Fe-Mn family superoxide dismutase [Verrucomicrobiae bacterium]|nr:Fe-Mn family superoxide dismutase [Verrucomicrobiae bacterium]
MGTLVSRRRFLAVTAVAGGLVASGTRAGAPPKESGLSSEGLLAGRPGFQPRTVMPLPYQELPGFLSREQLAAHHEEYARAVGRLKAVEEALRREEPDARRYAELRRAEVAVANSVLLHEFYFGGLSPRKVTPPRHIEKNMSEHMGSWDSWRDDFTRCALAARQWALLLYDPYDDRWHDAAMDSDGDGVWLGANPLVVCDVAEHALAKDYPRREDYVAKFLDHVDWEEVSRRYRAVDRM